MYQDDEFSAKKDSEGPIIANNGVRHRLLSAKDSLPGKVDLDVVASLVEEALGKKTPHQPDITTRSWYAFVSLITIFVLLY